ncbi:MAG: NUDIX domain-containing protein [Candidatus Wildermuthbacteria bacterium]|nr:NUDIX domain-containing protein [Candidatus Wildermuthbacteria bacterium]
MENFRIAVKSFIVQEGKLLVIRRRSDDVHKPGQWDIPGGRLELGEDPIEGLKRETREETNLEINIVLPIEVRHFTREDGQKITMIIFLCRLLGGELKLSKEHQEYEWVNAEKDTDKVPSWLSSVRDTFVKYNFGL